MVTPRGAKDDDVEDEAMKTMMLRKVFGRNDCDYGNDGNREIDEENKKYKDQDVEDKKKHKDKDIEEDIKHRIGMKMIRIT